MAAIQLGADSYEIEIAAGSVADIPLNPLPPAQSLLDAITPETDIRFLLRLAIEYHKNDRVDDAELVIRQCEHQSTHSTPAFQAYKAFEAAQNIVSMHLSKKTSSPETRAQLLASVEAGLAEHEQLDPSFLTLYIVRGLLALERGDLDRAAGILPMIVDAHPKHLPSLVVMASLCMRQGQWKYGLRFWQRALQQVSGNKNYPLRVQTLVRLNIGHCFARLGLTSLAQSAFTRVLQLESDNVHALAYMSSLYFNQMRKPDCSKSDKRAYLMQGVHFAQAAGRAAKKTNVVNPMLFARLADYSFMTGNDAGAQAMLDRAMPVAGADPMIMGELQYYHARMLHKRGDYEGALTEYKEAVAKNPDLLAARYAIAQILMYQEQLSEAIGHLDFIREKMRGRMGVARPRGGEDGARVGPGTSLGDDYDTLKLLALIHARLAEAPIGSTTDMATRVYQDQRERSRELSLRSLELFKLLYGFKSNEAVESGARDLQVLVVYARMLETSPSANIESRKSAMELYQRAQALLQKTQADKPVPVELTNNVGVLHHMQGNYLQAIQAYNRAFGDLRDLPPQIRNTLRITLQYNAARSHEELGQLEEAIKLYTAVAKRSPTYVDAHLRLAMIEHERGNITQAVVHAQAAMSNSPNSVEAHIYIGNLARLSGDTRQAKHSFGKILMTLDKFDLVSLLQLGNIWLFDTRVTATGSKHAAADERMKHLMEVHKLFDKVIQLDPRNAFAANGLAIALRERGYVDDALRTFEQVREADDSVACFAVNYAHMLAEVGDYRRAIPLFERAQERFFNGTDVDLLLATARAYYLMGKSTKNAQALRSSLNLIQRALRLKPRDLTLWLNLSIVLQDHTAVMSGERPESANYDEMQHAATLADLAIRNLRWLSHSRLAEAVLDQSIITQRANFTQSVKDRVEKRIDEMQRQNEERAARVQEMQQRAAEAKRVQLEREAQQSAAKALELERFMREWEAQKERMQDNVKLHAEMRTRESMRRQAAAASAAAAGGRRRGKKAAAGEEGFVVSDEDEAAGSEEDEQEYQEGTEEVGIGGGQTSKKSKKKSSRKSTSGKAAAKRSRKSAEYSGDEDGGEDGGDDESGATHKRKRLKRRGGTERMPRSAEYIVDSDEELAPLDDEVEPEVTDQSIEQMAPMPQPHVQRRVLDDEDEDDNLVD